MAEPLSVLVRPGVVAALLVSGALILHPTVGSHAWLPQRDGILAALALLITVALLARAATAPRRLPTILLAAGAAVVMVAVAGDGLRGHRGALDLVAGQSRTHFDERTPDGRSLGLRPLGFPIGLQDVIFRCSIWIFVPVGLQVVICWRLNDFFYLFYLFYLSHIESQV